jgi:meckelin
MQNEILKFFIAGFLFFCIGAVQLIWHNIESMMEGTVVNRFVDLCTLANISILMMDEHIHGYYIHAKAPWGSSDIPLDWLQKELHNEANSGSSSGRGLKGRAIR